jgi:superfamily II DNA or RNA helicase
MIEIKQFNETHLQIRCSDYGVEMELQEYFTFMAPNYKFNPKFKAKIWDGKIRLLNTRNKTLYKGLLNLAVKFCKDRKYDFTIDPELNPNTGIKEGEVYDFVDSLDLHARGNKLTVYDYQYQAVYQALKTKRNLLLSPTSSGKSLIIYSKLRYHIDKLDHRILIVVPTTLLVEQLFSDFQDYSQVNGWEVEDHVQLLYSGKEKLFAKSVMISTWQSLHAMSKNQPREFKALAQQVDVAIFDEAHTYKAAEVLSTMEKFVQTEYRTGTTGTIDNKKINELSLIGLMGPIYRVITTKELMDSGRVTKLKIKALVLEYPEHVRKAMKGMKYKDEIEFLVGNAYRNQFIANLSKACVGNTLILFNFVDKHGVVITDLVREAVKNTNRKVYFIHGGVDVADRDMIRKTAEHETDSIIIATASLFSTGINMPSIQNIIFAIPSKASIRIRQSIGRGLRLKDGKEYCTLFDIVDDLSWKAYKNTTLNHFKDRVAIYDSEQFDWSLTRVPIES